MNLSYKFKKFIVKKKQKYSYNKSQKAIAMLNQEQEKVFHMVMMMAEKNSQDIKFDPETFETLIVLPEMLITVTKFVVHIDNTHGFRSTQFPEDAFDIMDAKLNKEAHRVRRKLKHDVKMRINEFLNTVITKYDLQETEIHG